MTMWIVIGSLIGVVAIFLIVMSIRDKRKVKIVKKENEELELSRIQSKDNVIIFLNEIIDNNNVLLKNFVPSVGKYKMGDIRLGAKTTMEKFRRTKEFQLASTTEKNEKLVETFEKFYNINSNIWNKKLPIEISEIKKRISEMDKELIKNFKPEVKKLIKESYK